MVRSSFAGSTKGFTAIPRPIFDSLLCLPLSKRDLIILLLVARLTYGCRNAKWIPLKQADLVAVGIGPNHAKSCLQSLLARKFLLRNGDRSEYRLNEAFVAMSLTHVTGKRLDRLNVLVGYQLGSSSRNGNYLPKMGNSPFPNEELYSSQEGNISHSSDWSFSRSRRRFEKDWDIS